MKIYLKIVNQLKKFIEIVKDY